MNLNFGSINKSAITEEKINGAICFVVTESNRQLCFTQCSCKFWKLGYFWKLFIRFARSSGRVTVFEGRFLESFVHCDI